MEQFLFQICGLAGKMGKLKDCWQLSKTFKFIDKTPSPCYKSIPVNHKLRDKVYKEFINDCIFLPSYEEMGRSDEKPENIVVFVEPYFSEFEIGGRRFRLEIDRGAIMNGASVPSIVEYGDLKRWGQHVEDAFSFHDGQTAMNSLEFHLGNAVFIGILREVGLTSKRAMWLYNLGVNSRKGRKIYDESGAKEHHLSKFCRITEVL